MSEYYKNLIVRVYMSTAFSGETFSHFPPMYFFYRLIIEEQLQQLKKTKKKTT